MSNTYPCTQFCSWSKIQGKCLMRGKGRILFQIRAYQIFNFCLVEIWFQRGWKIAGTWTIMAVLLLYHSALLQPGHLFGCIGRVLFVEFVGFGSRNWVRLVFCNICKPCNQSLSLKQEKCHSKSRLSRIWRQRCRCGSYSAAQKVPTWWAVISPSKINCLFNTWRIQAWEWEWFTYLLLETGQEMWNCPSHIKIGSFQNPKHSSYLPSYSWTGMLMRLQLPWRVELSITVMWASELSVI